MKGCQRMSCWDIADLLCHDHMCFEVHKSWLNRLPIVQKGVLASWDILPVENENCTKLRCKIRRKMVGDKRERFEAEFPLSCVHIWIS